MSGTVELERIRLDRGGYEISNIRRYWGVGDPLFRWYLDADEPELGTMRAKDRQAARAELKRMFPHCKVAR